METIIQAGNKRLAIASIEITTNPKTRESRLFSNVFEHMAKSGQAIMRSYIMYRPWTVFAWLTGLFAIAGLAPFVRFAILRWLGDEGNHLQSLIFGVAMLVAALLSLALGVLSDLQRTNRILQEDQLERLRELRYGPLDQTPSVAPAHSEVAAPSNGGAPVRSPARPRRRAS
jgi:hypothetical protein